MSLIAPAGGAEYDGSAGAAHHGQLAPTILREHDRPKPSWVCRRSASVKIADLGWLQSGAGTAPVPSAREAWLRRQVDYAVGKLYFRPNSLSLCSSIAFFFAGYSMTTSSFLSGS